MHNGGQHGRWRGPVHTKGSKGSLMRHQRKETRLQCICDYDVKQLLKVLPVREREIRRIYMMSNIEKHF